MNRLRDLIAKGHEWLDSGAGKAVVAKVEGQWNSAGKFWRGGWRSSAGWALVATILVNGVVLPLARLFGFHGEPLPWGELAAFVAALVGLVHYRSQDLKNGVTT
ncbi:MAG: hypothetical protein JWP35_3521 [Caulobacter sp.]|nr:hypothetical protein [Caulobacter sp.]